MKLNDLLRAKSNAGAAIEVRRLDDETVLIEGRADDLRFLAAVLNALATAEEDSIQLGPRGAGSTFFSPSSELGVYLRRITTDEAP